MCCLWICVGHRRQGSSTEIKEDMCDVDIDIYITELSALLKLMQVMIVQTVDEVLPKPPSGPSKSGPKKSV